MFDDESLVSLEPLEIVNPSDGAALGKLMVW